MFYELIKENTQTSLAMFQPAIIEAETFQHKNSSSEIMKSGIVSQTGDSGAYKESIALHANPRESERASKPLGDYNYETYMKKQIHLDGSLIFSFGNHETLIVLSTAVLYIFCLSLNAPTSTYPAIAAFQIVIYDFSKH